MADPLALVFDVYCDFVTFPFGILGQVWYLIVSIPDPCCLSYFGCVFGIVRGCLCSVSLPRGSVGWSVIVPFPGKTRLFFKF